MRYAIEHSSVHGIYVQHRPDQFLYAFGALGCGYGAYFPMQCCRTVCCDAFCNGIALVHEKEIYTLAASNLSVALLGELSESVPIYICCLCRIEYRNLFNIYLRNILV